MPLASIGGGGGGGGGGGWHPFALLIFGVLSLFADAIEDTALFVLGILVDLGNDIHEAHGYLTALVDELNNLFGLGGLLGLFDITVLIQRVIDSVFGLIVNFLDYLDSAFYEVGRWSFKVRDFRDDLTDVINAIATWIDAFELDPLAALLSLIAPLLDPVGQALGIFYGLIVGTGYNPWDWIVANTPTIWDAFHSMFEAIWWALQDWLVALLTGASEILRPLLDPIGQALGVFYGLLRGTGENPWDWIVANTPTIWDAFHSMFEAIWWALQDWLVALLAGVWDVLAEPLSWIDWLKGVAELIQAFHDDSWEYLFALARGKLWPLVERWLIDVWDGVT